VARSHADRARVWLAGIRILNGALGIVAPSWLTRRVGGQPSAATTYAFHLFGIRTVLIGADLLSRDRDVRDQAVREAFPIHASDTATCLMLTLWRRVTPRAGVMLTAISAMNVVLALKARTRQT